MRSSPALARRAARSVTGWELDDAATGVYKAPADRLPRLCRIPQRPRDLRTLARQPNVSAKLSGLATEAGRSAWTPEDLRPAVAHAVEMFGPDRLMFGSDWPVCLLATSYQRWIDTVSGLLAGCDVQQRGAIWRRTAQRGYWLERT